MNNVLPVQGAKEKILTLMNAFHPWVFIKRWTGLKLRRVAMKYSKDSITSMQLPLQHIHHAAM